MIAQCFNELNHLFRDVFFLCHEREHSLAFVFIHLPSKNGQVMTVSCFGFVEQSSGSLAAEILPVLWLPYWN